MSFSVWHANTDWWALNATCSKSWKCHYFWSETSWNEIHLSDPQSLPQTGRQATVRKIDSAYRVAKACFSPHLLMPCYDMSIIFCRSAHSKLIPNLRTKSRHFKRVKRLIAAKTYFYYIYLQLYRHMKGCETATHSLTNAVHFTTHRRIQKLFI